MSRPRPKMVFDNQGSPPSPTSDQSPSLSAPTGTKTEKPARQASRIGKRAVTFYVSQEAFRQLGILSAQTDRSIQDMMVDALDSFFQSHGLARIAKE